MPAPARLAFLDGRFLPESAAVVSVLDRSFLYGDGVFETLYAHKGTPFRLDAHLDRLEQGAALLSLRVPFTRAEIAVALTGLLRRNTPASPRKNAREKPSPAALSPTAALLRITLSRGVGLRGYSPRGAERPTLVITQHDAQPRPAQPPGWHLRTASFRLPAGDRIAAIKSCNKLAQVLARAEVEAAGADEALLLNTHGRVVEAAAGNLFFVQDGVVCTPPLASGILPGVTRAVVLELCHAAGLAKQEVAPTPARLARAAGVWLTLSTVGIVAGTSLDGRALAQSPLMARLHADYWNLVERECARQPASASPVGPTPASAPRASSPRTAAPGRTAPSSLCRGDNL